MGSLFGQTTDPAAGSDPTSATVRNKLNWLREVLITLLVNTADDSAQVTLRDNIGRRPGNIIINAHAGAEPGCLPCDGNAYSRTTYAALFAKLGTTWGAGDGSTTFNVPLFNGKTLVFSGTGPGLTPRVVGETGGYEDATLPAHTHNVDDPGHTHGTAPYLRVTGTAISTTGPGNVTGVNSELATTGIAVLTTGESAIGKNMMPFGVCRAWVKY